MISVRTQILLDQRKLNGNPLQCSCLENHRDRGAWWAAVYGVSQSRTRRKRLSSSSRTHMQSIKSEPLNGLSQREQPRVTATRKCYQHFNTKNMQEMLQKWGMKIWKETWLNIYFDSKNKWLTRFCKCSILFVVILFITATHFLSLNSTPDSWSSAPSSAAYLSWPPLILSPTCPLPALPCHSFGLKYLRTHHMPDPA